MNRSLCGALALCSLTSASLASTGGAPLVLPRTPAPLHTGNAWTSARPDGHAPIGVMGDHRHAAGEWMVSYRFMRMEMDGSRDGSDRLTDQVVLAQGFSVTPTSMDMDMHMVGLMYAPTDQVTLMAMIPFLGSTMDHLTGMGGEFTTQSDGLGDIRLGGLIRLAEGEGTSLHLNANLSVPTGSLTERDDTPAGVSRLPFPMQIGSGTFDLQPGLTFLAQEDDWSWGAQGLHTLRLEDENDEGYRLGSRTDATAWASRKLSDRWSVSLRLAGARWGDIQGDDDTPPPPSFIPTADPKRRSGKRIDAGLGLNLLLSGGHRVALEALMPVYQDLDGPQLETDLTVVLGYQFAWGGSAH